MTLKKWDGYIFLIVWIMEEHHNLFIDFSPSEKGVKGQIVRFLHDPDEIGVIADSFDEYLEKLMEYELDFINEDTIE